MVRFPSGTRVGGGGVTMKQGAKTLRIHNTHCLRAFVPAEDKAQERQGGGRADRRGTHLPPAVAIDVILLNNLYAVSGIELNFVRIFWSEVEQRVNVFRHISHRSADWPRRIDGYSM